MLAIIIPYYKISYFEETLISLANQTNKNFKVYIGDDESNEDPADVLNRFKGKIEFIYHRFESNLGSVSLTQQWDRCIALSRDESWIMVLGDDDLLSANVVEEFYRKIDVINKKEINLVRFASQVINDQNEKKLTVFEHPVFENTSDSFWRKYKNQTRSSLSEYIFKKEIYLEKGFKNFPLAWHSDDYAWLSFSDNKPIFTINNAIVFIRIFYESISGKKDNLEKKNKAEAQFFLEIIKTKLAMFDKLRRLELLYQTEISLLKVKKISQYEWLILAKAGLNNFSVTYSLKFFRRYLIAFFK